MLVLDGETKVPWPLGQWLALRSGLERLEAAPHPLRIVGDGLPRGYDGSAV